MRKLLVIALLVNAALLAGRFWQELPANAQEDPGGPAVDERFCADSNGDGTIDLSDPITILQYLFTGGDAPYCIAQGDGLPQGLTPEQAEILSHLSIVQLPVDEQGCSVAPAPMLRISRRTKWTQKAARRRKAKP